MNYKPIFTLLMLFVFSHPLLAKELELTPENIPPAFSAEYSVVLGGITVAKVTYKLTKPSPDTWFYTSSSSPQGLASLFAGSNTVTDKADLKLIDNEILPVYYERERKTRKEDKSEFATYIWENEIAETSYKDRKADIDLSDNIIDKFTIQLLIMANVNNIPDYMILPVISKAKVDEYEIINYGPEQIDTVYGKRDAIKVERKKDESSYIIWADLNAHGLPLQIQKVEDGKVEYTVRIQNSTLITTKKVRSSTIQQSSYPQSR
ncbi:MAG: DUF3108 domain-containing protein [Pseudomonadota bacterium]